MQLVDELEAKAREFRGMQYDTVIRQTAEKPLNDGTAGALEEVAGEVRKIDAEIAGPEAARNAVRELAARLESEVAQIESQSREIPDIAGLLFNPAKMFGSLRDMGRGLGLKQAAAEIRRYLNTEPGS